MFEKRSTSYVLTLINLVLILFVILRAGSETIEPKTSATRPLTIHKLERPPGPSPDTLILNDFEKTNDLGNLYDQGGDYSLSLSHANATHGESSLLVDKVYESNIEFATAHFPRCWEKYDSLKLDVYNDTHELGSLWLRIGSHFDSKRFYIESQRYAESFRLPPGESTIAISIEKVAQMFGQLPERKSLHFNFPAGKGRRYFLDYLRLEKHDRSSE